MRRQNDGGLAWGPAPVTGNVVRVRVEDSAGNPEINRENQRRQQELLDKVADLDFPQNPLDALLGRFGADNVAEISGRSHRFENGRYVRRKLDGIPRRELNEYETRLFQQGRNAALARLYQAIQSDRHRDEGLGMAILERMGVLNKEKTAVRENYVSNVEQFLNRIMVLHVETQNRMFEHFYQRYLEVVDAAKRQSAFDFGVEEIQARNLRRVAEAETLFVDSSSGAKTMLHELEGEVDVVRRSFDSLASSAKLGFFRNRQSRRIYAVADHWDADRGELQLTAVKGPRRSLEPDELRRKYEDVENQVARVWWEAEYDNTSPTEPRRFHILSGAIFPIYDKVMGSSGIQSVKIARAILSDGQALVGLNLSAEDVPNVKQRLGIGTPLGDASPAEIMDLLAGGSLIELDNGWRLTTARIAGDQVVELMLNGVPANRDELLGHGLSEEIIHYKRRWFAVQEDAGEMLSRLLDRRKAVKTVMQADPGAL
jgi:hypothetical protein